MQGLEVRITVYSAAAPSANCLCVAAHHGTTGSFRHIATESDNNIRNLMGVRQEPVLVVLEACMHDTTPRHKSRRDTQSDEQQRKKIAQERRVCERE